MLDDRFYIAHGPVSLQDLIMGLEAELLDPKFQDEMIYRACPVAGAAVGSIVYLSDKKSLNDLKSCKATACFVSEDLSASVGAQHIIPIISKTPRAHFARALALLATRRTLSSETGTAQIAKSASVHSSAVIGAGAIVGNDTTVAPNVVIGPGVKIGRGCIIGANVSIMCTVMGNNCVVKASAVIGGRGFGVDKDESGFVDIPHIGRVVIGSNVHIGSNTCIDRGQLGDTILADDVKIDNLAQIAHNVEIGQGCLIAAQAGIAGSCKIGSNVIMGGNVGMVDHIVIGDNVQIAARAGVMHNIPAGEVWSGIPAQPIRDHMRMVAVTRKLARKNKTEPK